MGWGNAGVTEKNRTDELTKGAGKMDGQTMRLKRVRSDCREEMTLKIMQISGHPLHTRLGNMVSEGRGWLSPHSRDAFTFKPIALKQQNQQFLELVFNITLLSHSFTFDINLLYQCL